MVARVVINNQTHSLDKIFHYAIPSDLLEFIKIGMRVILPFGHSNKKIEGIVVGFAEDNGDLLLKNIEKILDNSPIISQNMLSVALFMKEKYHSSYYDCIKAVMPPGMGYKSTEFLRVCKNASINLDDYNSSPLQREILKALIENKGSVSYDKLCQLLNRDNIRNPLKSLVSKGIIEAYYKEYENVKSKTEKMAFLVAGNEDTSLYIEKIIKKAPVQARMLDILMQNELVSVSDLVYFTSGSMASLNSLKSKGLIDFKEQIVENDPYKNKEYIKTQHFIPTNEQKEVLNRVILDIDNKNYEAFLLKGVTGSGKTEVFLQLIDRVLKNKRQAIMLVPEIALTPQTVEIFKGRFERVAVFHSGLSLSERFDQWKKIKNGEVDVAVGARSCVFAPFENLGIIIIDEEHENTYKSELSPKYHTREVANFRAKNENAVLLLASATPSVESYFNAQNKKYTLLNMNSRYNSVMLPEIIIADMRQELKDGNKSMFSRLLHSEILKNIQNGEQTILFLNRRGYSTFVSCRSCGFVASCPHCSISLTYHMKSNTLACHYCGYRTNNFSLCPDCNSKSIKFFGAGTQKLEDEIKKEFPNASVIRMDTDTTYGKFSHEKILKKFKDEKIDILIGTQMVTKGLDIKNVSLVGVIAADSSLNIDDFRSSERTFSQITQVCGRAGRGEKKGRAIVQTYMPDSYAIMFAKTHNYELFYQNEIKFRKSLNYPPFCDIINIVVSGADESKLKLIIFNIYQLLNEKYKNGTNAIFEIMKPSKAPIYKIKERFRYRVLFKATDCPELHIILDDVINNYYNDKNNKDFYISVDINPTNLY